jgi:hypothetical protein
MKCKDCGEELDVSLIRKDGEETVLKCQGCSAVFVLHLHNLDSEKPLKYKVVGRRVGSVSEQSVAETRPTVVGPVRIVGHNPKYPLLGPYPMSGRHRGDQPGPAGRVVMAMNEV